jgi:hypothetical protein
MELSFSCWRNYLSRFLVALPRVQDLLLCAKNLFIEAIVAGADISKDLLEAGRTESRWSQFDHGVGGVGGVDQLFVVPVDPSL